MPLGTAKAVIVIWLPMHSEVEVALIMADGFGIWVKTTESELFWQPSGPVTCAIYVPPIAAL